MKFIHQEVKVLSPEITLIYYWEDLTSKNPYYRFGTDENRPFCCTYKNGKLVSTLIWSKDEKLETIERLLKEKTERELIPGYSDCPCEERQ